MNRQHRITIALAGALTPSFMSSLKKGEAGLREYGKQITTLNEKLKVLYAERRTISAREEPIAAGILDDKIANLRETLKEVQLNRAQAAVDLRPYLDTYDEAVEKANEEIDALDKIAASRRVILRIQEEQAKAAKSAAIETLREQEQVRRGREQIQAMLDRKQKVEEQDARKKATTALKDQETLRKGRLKIQEAVARQQRTAAEDLLIQYKRREAIEQAAQDREERLERERRANRKSMKDGLKQAGRGVLIFSGTFVAASATVVMLTDKYQKLEAVARNTGTTIDNLRSVSNSMALGLDLMGAEADAAAKGLGGLGETLEKMFTTGEARLNPKSLYFAGIRDIIALRNASAGGEAALLTELRRQLGSLGAAEQRSALMHLDDVLGPDIAEAVGESLRQTDAEWAETLARGTRNMLSQGQIDNLEETRTAVSRLGRTTENYADQVRASFAPAVTMGANSLTALAEAAGPAGVALLGIGGITVGATKGIMDMVGGITDALIAYKLLGLSVTGFIGKLKLLRGALLLTKLSFIATWLAALGPIGLIIAGIAAVTAALAAFFIWMKKRNERNRQDANTFGHRPRTPVMGGGNPATGTASLGGRGPTSVNIYNDFNLSNTNADAQQIIDEQEKRYSGTVIGRPAITGGY